jgi:hypothetical protein
MTLLFLFQAIIALANPHQNAYIPHNFEDAAGDGATAVRVPFLPLKCGGHLADVGLNVLFRRASALAFHLRKSSDTVAWMCPLTSCTMRPSMGA